MKRERSPTLPDEVIGTIVGLSNLQSDSRVFKACRFNQDVEAFSKITTSSMYDKLRSVLTDILKRLKEKTVETDGHPNRFVFYRETSQVPDHLLAAWPSYVNNDQGWYMDEISTTLKPDFCSYVAEELEHTIVTGTHGSQELCIPLDQYRPPGIKHVSLNIQESYKYEYDFPGPQEEAFNERRRTLNLVVMFDDDDQYDICICMNEDEWPDHFFLSCVRRSDTRPYDERQTAADVHRHKTDVVAVISQCLLNVHQDQRPYLKIYAKTGPLSQHLKDECWQFGIVRVAPPT
jgi:hypothetical protein